jgi:Na+-transporting methylmalonyl-CoA/oxaloacetate decarboxylase gamma subunit
MAGDPITAVGEVAGKALDLTSKLTDLENTPEMKAHAQAKEDEKVKAAAAAAIAQGDAGLDELRNLSAE